MLRSIALLCASLLVLTAPARADELKGDYLETRTCDVYTGPCFANGQVGLTGRDALMAWSIDRGSYEGVDLAGLKVVVVTTASDTLGFGGTLVIHPEQVRSLVLVDQKANTRQRQALAAFAAQYARHAGEIVKVLAAPIDMTVDHFALIAALDAGPIARLETRKLHQGDCICSNEQTFYPPLNDVRNAVPAYTVDGQFNGSGLGTTWSNPGTRSAFVASFSY